VNKLNIHCPHFSNCSGCIVDADVESIKTITEAKKFFAEHRIVDFKVVTGLPVNWRCRAKLVVCGTAEMPLIGLYKAGSHEVIEIPNCKVHHPLINIAVVHLRNWIRNSCIVPYEENTGKGLLRYVQLAVDRHNHRVQLVLVLNQQQEKNFPFIIKEATEKLWKTFPNFWHSIWLNFNTRRDNVIFGDLWQKIYGEEWLWDSFCGRQICFHPASFAQANPDLFEMLLFELRKNVPHGTHVVEYYAGGGVIGFTLVEQCKSICCNEIVPLAKKCFEETQKLLPKVLAEKISFVGGSAADHADLINMKTDIVIVDPPRKGLDEPLLKQLCDATIKRLIYVSCGWKSFQRDCKKLLENGWQLKKATSFLFFPGSDHLEVLAVFDKVEKKYE
jgi:23S rRNA (uracil1939-C5)-methyltransferase